MSLVLAGLAFYVVAGRSTELGQIGSYLGRIEPGWVVGAAVLELVSVFCFALVQWQLFRAGGVPVPVLALYGITMAGNSITNSLPAGPAWASYFAFRQYRAFGADNPLSAWILLGWMLASLVTLALIAAGGLVVASTTHSGSFGITNSIVSVFFVAVAISLLVLRILHRRGALESMADRIIRLLQRFIHRPAGESHLLAQSVAQRFTAVSPSRGAISATLGWAMLNWVTDLSALVVSFLALGVRVPWAGILLAYGAGQLAANLPITPGGLGVVEGSLELALVAYGGSQSSTVAVVLLYRMVSFWFLLPLGWLAWLGIHFAERKGRPVSVPVLAAEGAAGEEA